MLKEIRKKPSDPPDCGPREYRIPGEFCASSPQPFPIALFFLSGSEKIRFITLANRSQCFLRLLQFVLQFTDRFLGKLNPKSLLPRHIFVELQSRKNNRYQTPRHVRRVRHYAEVATQSDIHQSRGDPNGGVSENLHVQSGQPGEESREVFRQERLDAHRIGEVDHARFKFVLVMASSHRTNQLCSRQYTTSISLDFEFRLELGDSTCRDIECRVPLDEIHESIDGLSRQRQELGRVMAEVRVVSPRR